MHRVLVLGGYGFFGLRISSALAGCDNIFLLIGGRNLAHAQRAALSLGLSPEQGMCIDCTEADFSQRLSVLQIDTIIHTAGPFQGQDYAVARAAITAGANYIDLADGRDFAAGIGQLDALARERGVLIVSGASSLPALSSAVVDRYIGRFASLESIRVGIGSGARAPGVATMQGIFGYCGKPIQRLQDGSWQTTFGWLDMQRYRFPAPVGSRFLGSCDVPDLALFPLRYPGVRTVTFHAGFASMLGHLTVWAAAQMVHLGLLASLAPLVKPLHRISQWLEPLVSDKGAMFVSLQGIGVDGKKLELNWHLIACRNHGPQIPCGASIALAKKLAQEDKLPPGAMPCMGLLTVEDYLAALREFDIRELPA